MTAVVEVECPVCSDAVVEFPRWDHARAGDHGACDPPCECCGGECDCIGEDEERNCPHCGARIVWHCDGEAGWPWVDDDDPAWRRA